jgi:signal transduction histidine kinase
MGTFAILCHRSHSFFPLYRKSNAKAIPPKGEGFSPVKWNNKVVISVRDSGSGIPPENLDKVFEPLFTTKAKGIGLGLAVSKNLLEANGGQITVESEADKGTIFTLFLPTEREEA